MQGPESCGVARFVTKVSLPHLCALSVFKLFPKGGNCSGCSMAMVRLQLRGNDLVHLTAGTGPAYAAKFTKALVCRASP